MFLIQIILVRESNLIKLLMVFTKIQFINVNIFHKSWSTGFDDHPYIDGFKFDSI